MKEVIKCSWAAARGETEVARRRANCERLPDLKKKRTSLPILL